MSFNAVDPEKNITVAASAGTGKTWQLVTRLLRLLLANVPPGAILAVTFTRKAAGEMQTRLLSRLEEWATADTAQLDAALTQIGCTPTEALRQQARALYEHILLCPQPVRTTTFHAFCHDLLARFPLEADVPPGFELVEQTLEQRDLAWEAMIQSASLEPEGELAQSLEYLFDACRGIPMTRQAVDNFLHHRSDWWAYTEDQHEPLDWALNQLQQQFGVNLSDNPQDDFFARLTPLLNDYAHLLGSEKASPTNKKRAANLREQLAVSTDSDELFLQVKNTLLTGKGEPRSLKPSKNVIAELGQDTADKLVDLHHTLSSALMNAQDQVNRQNNLRLNQAWYRVGNIYLDFYQSIKTQRRQLDFSDLEWRAYRLLNRQDNALWVQYKLDQQIDHLLIDEFQDTNPTQWRLIFPLLEEFAASDTKATRSVFIVGDSKQSIYSFRRANPQLQQTAAEWLAEHLAAESAPLDISRRSAPAIMEAVNAIFDNDEMRAFLPDFTRHSTYKTGLWGRVEILPVAHAPELPEEGAGLRNPLLTGRPELISAATIESEQIAERIQTLVNEGWVIGEDEEARPIRYGDILILLRQRTRAQAVEQALRAAKIPYRGTARGTLLSRLEVQDIYALINLINTPQDNLALAHVLRSPIFSASNDDLVMLAKNGKGIWFERLQLLAEALPPDHPLQRAAVLLPRWRKASDSLPLHDLLDQVYYEAQIIARYQAAAPGWQQAQITANLQRLIELALEVDSGRYPSLTRFLLHLDQLGSASNDAPHEPMPHYDEMPVRILTIHESKGLEAPVVIYADLAASPPRDRAWSTLVEWPAEAERPQCFLLQPRSDDIDSISQNIRQRWQHRQNMEAANLLYVALTRPRQMLILSASQSRQNSKRENQYQQLQRLLEPLGTTTEDGHWYFQTGTIAQATDQLISAADDKKPLPIEPGLQQRFTLKPPFHEIAPSRMNAPPADGQQAAAQVDEDSLPRGQIIHLFLEYLAQDTPWTEAAMIHRVAADLSLPLETALLHEGLTEAKQTMAKCPEIFQGNYLRAFNEIPLLYRLGKQQVYGVIDRVLIFDDYIQLIDYKTHRIHSEQDLSQLANHYQSQLQYYARGLEKLWPGYPVNAEILFTHTAQRVPVALDARA